MKSNICDLCDKCQLGNQDFQQAIAKVKSFVNHFPVIWWSHCFPGDEGFSIPEFFKGLDWFLRNAECPGCKDDSGKHHCPIRHCASKRHCAHCHECPEFQTCMLLKFEWGQLGKSRLYMVPL